MPITSLLHLTLHPAAVEDAAGTRRLISDVLRATRATSGCLGCEVLIDTEDPAHVVVHERWESLEHDDAYRAWRRTPEGASRLGDVLAEPPALSRFATADGV